MAISNGQLLVSTTAVMVDGTANQPFSITLYNMSQTDDIYVGDSNVTPTSGLELHPHTYCTIHLQAGDQLWAVSAGQNRTICWLKVI